MTPGKRSSSLASEARYLEVSYDPQKIPFGPYPGKLARWIHDEILRRPGDLLDAGCGRGEFLTAFAALGYRVIGIDASPAASRFAPGMDIRAADFERDALPVSPGTFDFAFSKSVVEHLRDPDRFLRGLFDALKPGGIAVVMTPSWSHNAWGPFYIDHTHVTPFTLPSLEQALRIAGFDAIECRHFYQLPSVWRRPGLALVCRLIAALPIPFRPFHKTAPWPDNVNKFIRFSNEVMLLAVGRKPAAGQGGSPTVS